MANAVSYRDLIDAIENLRKEMNTNFDRVNDVFEKKTSTLERRLSVAENWQSNIMGKLAVVSTIVFVIINAIGNYIYDRLIRGWSQ
jgi:Mg2+ and Co2+ transporter CorA